MPANYISTRISEPELESVAKILHDAPCCPDTFIFASSTDAFIQNDSQLKQNTVKRLRVLFTDSTMAA